MYGTYIGAAVPLQNEKALLQEVPGSDNVKAQFDNMELVFDGKQLGFGWHLFRREDFSIDPPVDWGDDEPEDTRSVIKYSKAYW